MLNQEQNRNYNRCQKLQLFLGANQTIYSTYIPFNKEAQNFTVNFGLFQNYTTQKNTNGTQLTQEQKELKIKIAETVAAICRTAMVYAEQYNNTGLAVAIGYNKTEVLRQKDPDVYGLVQGITSLLQPLLNDANFMEYDITSNELDALMADATTFRNNISRNNVVENGGSVANKNINGIIKQLDKNVKTFDRLIAKFAANHPDFVAGYRINAALENAPARYTGIEGIVTSGATGQPIANALVSIQTKYKKATTNNAGSYTIVSMYSGESEVTVSANGFTTKTVKVRIPRGKIVTLNITL